MNTWETMSFISAKSSAIDLADNDSADMIMHAIKELPEWVNDSKCFGILTIEKHFEGFYKKRKLKARSFNDEKRF